MGALLRDVRFALRVLAKSPGYTIVAVMTLALAIGANTAIFSTVNAVLLRPLPYRDADRLMIMTETSPTFHEMSVTYPSYRVYREKSRTFESIGAFRTDAVNLTGQGPAEQLSVRMISANLLDVLGVKPVVGRSFTADEDRASGAKAVMLSHGFWKRRFGGDPRIVGRSILLDGQPFQVVGVTSPSFHVYEQKDVFLPLGLRENAPGFGSFGSHPGINMVGRLAPGVTPRQAQAELVAIAAGIEAENPMQYKGTHAMLQPLHEDLAEDFRPQLLLLMGAVAFVLLIAAANVANLMLGRAMDRAKEMGIRAALGSGRLRLVRQLLVEAALVALAGAAVGLLLAVWGVDLLAAGRPKAVELLGAIELDGRVLGFTIVVALATGVLFGLAPALTASRQDLAQVMKEGDHRATAGGGKLRVRNLLVIGEVALALVLLAGAGLAMRGFLRLTERDPGFRVDGLLRMSISMPEKKYDTAPKLRAFQDELLRRVGSVPGVESVAITTGLPIVGSSESSFEVADTPVPESEPRMAVTYIVSHDYLKTMKTPLVRGRDFSADLRPGGAKEIIIDTALADKFFPGEDPLGKQLRMGDPRDPLKTVVGVARHVAHYGLEGREQAPYQLYLPIEALPDEDRLAYTGGVEIVLRTAGDPDRFARQVQAEIAAIDPDQPIYDVSTMEAKLAASIADRRFTTFLLGIFGVLAVMIAGVGIYAVMSNSVSRRTHELGIRMALGAQPGDVIRLVVRQGLTLVLVGLAVGVIGSFALTRVMRTILSGVSATDPTTFVVTSVVLVAVGALATYIPARRATRVDPMVALRSE
jgi:putative ABC transport system permease protein